MAKTTSSSNEWGRFQTADRDAQPNIIGASQGPAGSGKTFFWLTAPEPIAVFLFDPAGLKGLLNAPQFKKKDIRVINYYEDTNIAALRDKPDRAKAAMECYERFVEDWTVAKKKARTAIWDKEDHVWEMLRYAHNEDFQAEPKSYHELNQMYRGWFSEAEKVGLNLGVIRGLKEKWGKTGQKLDNRTGRMKDTFGTTGELVARGQKEVEELVQVNFEHAWDNDQREFVVTIGTKCRLGPAKDLIGQSFPDLSFPLLATLLFPDTEESDWT